MKIDSRRVLALALKEVREYRRTPFIVGAMASLPLVFMIEPILVILLVPAAAPAAAVEKSVGLTFLLLLITPAVIPATIAAYSVVGEREQGTLEPLLTTPVRREEILLGKALATILPAVGVAYLLFILVELFAHFFASNQTVASTLAEGPHILADLVFAPLLAMWSIWVGTAVSTRSSDVRVAQQLGTMASLPPLAATALVSFQVLPTSVVVALAFASGLLVLDIVMWWLVTQMFDRERLITGSRASTSTRAGEAEPRHIRRIRAD